MKGRVTRVLMKGRPAHGEDCWSRHQLRGLLHETLCALGAAWPRDAIAMWNICLTPPPRHPWRKAFFVSWTHLPPVRYFLLADVAASAAYTGDRSAASVVFARHSAAARSACNAGWLGFGDHRLPEATPTGLFCVAAIVKLWTFALHLPCYDNL